MRLKEITIGQYRNFNNVTINLEKNDFSPVYALASANGGGKSTLLQFVFTLLRCFTDESKYQYIANLLDGYEFAAQMQTLAVVTVEDDEGSYELAFLFAPYRMSAAVVLENTQCEDVDFALFLELQEAEQKLANGIKQDSKYSDFIDYKKRVLQSTKVADWMLDELSDYKEFRTTSSIKQIWDFVVKNRNLGGFHTLVKEIYASRDFNVRKSEKLQPWVDGLKEQVAWLTNALACEGMTFVSFMNDNQHAFLLKTQLPEDKQRQLSQQVYLTAPSSQVYLFLSQQHKQDILRSFSDNDRDVLGDYASHVQAAKQALSHFFTFDFSSTDLIIQAFKNALELDVEQKIRTHQFGQHFDNLKQELSEFLDGKTISVDEKFERVIFTMNDGKTQLDPTDLSHGELKKLSLFVWLNYIVPKNSIVFMDEVDIALHPRWQYQLVEELPKWSQNSQFLLATHSPQILSATYYKNLIKLVVEDGKNQVKRFNKPPVDRDMNATVTEVMDAPEMPKALKQLHKDYRQMVEAGKTQTDEAKALKALLLEYESENSAFFQDINFDMDLD